MNKKVLSIITLVIIIIAGGGVFAYRHLLLPEKFAPAPEMFDKFPFTIGDTYAHAKTILKDAGWEPYVPVDTIEPLKSANDKDFPEIIWCGEGIDAICSVNFKKSPDLVNHLNVNHPGLGNGDWIVVGGE